MRDTEGCFHGRLEVLAGCMGLLKDGFVMLEIGACTGNVLNHCKHLMAEKSAVYVGVDKDLSKVDASYPMAAFVEKSSDDYFNGISASVKFDLIFVDGDHSMGVAVRDTQNAIDHLAPGGIIVVHDVESYTYDATGGPRNAVKLLLENPRFYCRLFVWDESSWLGSTFVAVDMDRGGVDELFSKESKP